MIPVYNRYELLKEAVASVLAQSYHDFEIIVIDDGSEDGADRITGLSEKIRYYRYEHTGFPGLMRNRGVAHAAGELTAFLDSDDLFEPGKLELQLEELGSSASLLCHTREKWLRGQREISQKRFTHRRRGDVFPDALKKCIIGPSTVLMDRACFLGLGGFREDLEVAEDYEFWLRYTALHPVAYCDEPLITKRAGHGGQLSEKYGQIEIFRIRGLRDLVEDNWFLRHASRSHQRMALLELADKCRIYSDGAEKRGRTGEAQEFRDLSGRYLSDAQLLGED